MTLKLYRMEIANIYIVDVVAPTETDAGTYAKEAHKDIWDYQRQSIVKATYLGEAPPEAQDGDWTLANHTEEDA